MEFLWERIWTEVCISTAIRNICKCIFFLHRYRKINSGHINKKIELKAILGPIRNILLLYIWKTSQLDSFVIYDRGGKTFWWEGRITGLWIIIGPYLLKSKEFSLDSSASVYFIFSLFFRGFHRFYRTVQWTAYDPQAAVCPPLIFTILLINPCEVLIYSIPILWAGYDTRSIFKQNRAGLNSEFSF